MSEKYLLPCSCGEQVSVGVSQAGGNVSCSCGNQLVVPSMREIRRLEPAAEAEAISSPSGTWQLWQGLVLAGLVVTLAGGGYTARLYSQMPEPPRHDYIEEHEQSLAALDRMPIHQAYGFWHDQVKGFGLRDHITRADDDYRQAKDLLMQQIYVSGAVAAAGVLLLITAVTIGFASRKSNRQPAAA